ncbi:MAG: G5 domain-containing protein [Scrofimicrobium sp.]
MASKTRLTPRRALIGVLSVFALSIPAMAASGASADSSKADQTIADPHEGQKLVRVGTIPYRTVVIDDDSLPDGVEVEEQAGVDGVTNVYAGVTDTILKYSGLFPEVAVEPIDRVIHRGTKIDLPIAQEPVPEPEAAPEPEPVIAVAERSQSTAPTQSSTVDYGSFATTGEISLSDFMFRGVVGWNGMKFTYYSQSVLSGPGLAIPGRHVNEAGYVADSEGYIVLAAPYGVAHGTTFATPFGYTGKVYDTCASCSTSPLWLDVYIR